MEKLCLSLQESHLELVIPQVFEEGASDPQVFTETVRVPSVRL